MCAEVIVRKFTRAEYRVPAHRCPGSLKPLFTSFKSLRTSYFLSMDWKREFGNPEQRGRRHLAVTWSVTTSWALNQNLSFEPRNSRYPIEIFDDSSNVLVTHLWLITQTERSSNFDLKRKKLYLQNFKIINEIHKQSSKGISSIFGIHVKITFRSSKHNFQVVFLAVKSISFLGWVLNLLTLKNIAINFMVSFTTTNSISPQKTVTLMLVTKLMGTTICESIIWFRHQHPINPTY